LICLIIIIVIKTVTVRAHFSFSCIENEARWHDECKPMMMMMMIEQ